MKQDNKKKMGKKKKRIKDARSDGMTLQEKYRPALCCASLRTYCRVFLTFPPPLQTSSFFFFFSFFEGVICPKDFFASSLRRTNPSVFVVVPVSGASCMSDLRAVALCAALFYVQRLLIK